MWLVFILGRPGACPNLSDKNLQKIIKLGHCPNLMFFFFVRCWPQIRALPQSDDFLVFPGCSPLEGMSEEVKRERGQTGER